MEDMAALWYPGQGPVVRCRCGPALPSYAARRSASPEVPLLRRKSLYCRLFVAGRGSIEVSGAARILPVRQEAEVRRGVGLAL